MDREQALKFLLEDCLFSDPLTLAAAGEIWESYKTIVRNLPREESITLRKLPLSAADLKAARKFRRWHPDAESVIDFVKLNPMDLIVHQLWASSDIADGYRDKVAPDKWLYTALLDPPSDSGVKWRREADTIVFDLPHSEFFLSGPVQPSGEMRVSEAQGFVTVAFHADRALLLSGYHRTFACAQRTLNVENAPRGILFGVSNQLAAMGSSAVEVLRMMEGPRPPRMADFFDDRVFLPVTLRRRRYQMRINYRVAEIEEEETQRVPEQNSLTLRQPSAVQNPDLRPDGRRDVWGILADAQKHSRAGRMDDAVAHYERALFLRPDHADAHNNLGSALLSQGKLDDATAHFERTLAIDPDHAAAHNNLGTVFRDEGRFSDAMAHYERAIAIRPDYTEAHFNRAELTTFDHDHADLKALEALAAGENISANKAPFLHFALAKAYEDCGDYARAFEWLRKGNALKRSQIKYDEKSVMEHFQRISRVFGASLLDRLNGEGDPSLAPVFVLGMPRSGSSLIEQVLASHPQIYGAGERADLDIAMSEVLAAGDQPVSYPECVPALDGATLRRIGQAYLARLPALAAGQVRVVDKSPGNFLNVGLIRLILPNARIVHTMRNPIDTCASCYSKLFSSGQHFSYDMAELGRYYRSYSEMMAHWRSVLPPAAMLEVSYEDVVDDLQGQARRLIDYCGLPWDDRCIDFHKSIRSVRTASGLQVRQPLFRSSLQRWRRYELGLAPLLQALGDIVPEQSSVGSHVMAGA
jgi:tetratricopeptide (TPR) repeat protein